MGLEDYSLKSTEIPFLLKGRSAEIFNQKETIGYFGEIHPQILERWDIKMPCSILEIHISNLIKNEKEKKSIHEKK